MTDVGVFNHDFSDRVLHLEILSEDTSDSNSDREGCDCIPMKKRKREDLDEEIGDEAAHSDYPECSTLVEVKTLQINSPILAEKSLFFYKLFENGNGKSQQRTLRINASEEAPFMDLLNFIYKSALSATSAPDLLNVLIVAHKFEVTSCMRYCSELLHKLPMSLESALVYIKLPSSVLRAEEVQPLILAAKQFLTPVYKLQEEAMSLTLPAVEIVLSSDDVQVKYEDEVLDFILKWARAHYPKPEECREILTKRLLQLIRFPYMSCWKLKKVQVSRDFKHEQVSKLVREALFFKSGLPYKECVHALKGNSKNRRFIERAYEYRPIKVVQLQLPRWPRCVVYLDLRKDECANLFPSKGLFSQPFHLGGKCFFLEVKCDKDLHTFGLFVYMPKKYKTCTLDYEFKVKTKPSEEFQSKYIVGNCTLSEGKSNGQINLFGIPWAEFINDDDYFIDGILHLRAEFTLKKSIASPHP